MLVDGGQKVYQVDDCTRDIPLFSPIAGGDFNLPMLTSVKLI